MKSMRRRPIVGGMQTILSFILQLLNLLILFSTLSTSTGFILVPSASSRYHPPSHPGSDRVWRPRGSATPAPTALGSADNADSEGLPPSDAEISLDLQARIKDLGLGGDDVKAVGTDNDSSTSDTGTQAQARNNEGEFIYTGGERFYLPSSARSSLPTTIDSKEGEILPRRQSVNSFKEATSRRELLREARPGIIGSLEGLALALSLFFVLTVIATGGRLFAPFASISDEFVSPVSSSSSTTLFPRQRIVLDPDTLLKEDFARDGSSVFYGGQAVHEKDP